MGGGATGHHEVCDYVRMVTTTLSGYRSDVESLITEGNHAVVKVSFSGLHVGEFLAYPPTGRHVKWIGAAFFTGDENKLRDIWELGDLDSLRGQLSSSV